MKTTKIAISILFAGFALQQSGFSQTNTDAAADTNSSAMSMTASNQPVMLPAAVTDTNAASTNAVNSVADTDATQAAATDETADATNPPVAPPIIFQDVPLTTAIEALAREANINYLMDPKINYGQPDQNGQVKPEPTVSVRWENVSYQQALVALLDNYGLQMVENPKTKIYQITIRNPSAPAPLITRVIQLKYASTSNMTAAVASTFTDRRSRVLPDVRTSQLVVIATDPEQAAVDTLIADLDKPTRQVLIETKILELSSNPSTQKGIDWSGTLAAQNVSFGNNVSQAGRYSRTYTVDTAGGITNITEVFGAPQALASPGLLVDTAKGFNPTTGFLDADGVSAVLSFLNSSADAQVLSTPRIVTLDNETATISVTRSYPIFNITASTANTTGGSQITYSNIGTILEVTPRISANDYIWLNVHPTVSSYYATVTKTVLGTVNEADEFDNRDIDTQVLIPNSHTLVMGGLVKDDPNAQYTKVPFLGDIPVLGLAFRHENNSEDKDNLLIFITPTIVKDSDFKATSSTFLDSQPRTMVEPMNPNSLYDGAQKGGNWSDPLQSTVK